MASVHMPAYKGGPSYSYVHVDELAQGQTQAYQAYVHRAPEPSGLTAVGMTRAAGAAISLALIIGVGVWGYKLIVRDVSGLPVVQATEGPMRVAPETPGGQQADHQGLAVNEVAGRGAAAGPADQLVLAPTPVDLEAEDAPAENLQLASVVAGQAVETPAPQSQPSQPLSPQDSAIQALADQIAAGVAPLSDAAGAAPTEAVQTLLSTPAAPAADPSDPSARSLRPIARPAQLRVASANAVAPAATLASASASDVDPASLPTGTRLVQLGAYDSAEVAKQEWGVFQGKFDSYFEGKRRVIERAQSGGRTFYRLRAEGFGDLADARRFCAALVAEGSDCIPVVTR